MYRENWEHSRFQKNKEALATNSTRRELNGVVELKLFPFFEEAPQHWATIAFLPRAEEVKGKNFEDYLRVWHDKVPPIHKDFVAKIARQFGFAI